MIDSITIKGVASKKNSNKITCSGGYPRTYKVQKYKDWYDDAYWQLKEQKIPQDKLKKINSITYSFYLPDKKRRDLTNLVQSIEDLLVDYQFIEDDNFNILPSIQIMYMGISKANPRCEIELSY